MTSTSPNDNTFASQKGLDQDQTDNDTASQNQHSEDVL
jgi:hypothetical protein